MELLDALGLTDVLLSKLLDNAKHNKHEFNPDVLIQHSLEYSKEYSYKDARMLLQLSMTVTGSNFKCQEFQLPEILINKGFIRYILCHGTCGILGYAIYNPSANTLVIVFTGTSNICLGKVDLEYTQCELKEITNYIPGIKGHGGMYEAYLCVRNELLDIIEKYPNVNVVITGHSLGGALSTLCALDLAYYEPIHYSFACPLYFNNEGWRLFDAKVVNSYRVVNISDIVTMIPFAVMPNKDCFCHVGKPVIFQHNLCDYFKNHATAYIEFYQL